MRQSAENIKITARNIYSEPLLFEQALQELIEVVEGHTGSPVVGVTVSRPQNWD